MDISGPSGFRKHCRLCLISLKAFREGVEITENVSTAILEIFPLDVSLQLPKLSRKFLIKLFISQLICFQSTSIFICEKCLANIETCSSFRLSIVKKHQELIGKIKIENVDVKAEGFTVPYIEENRIEDFTSLVNFPEHG